MYTKTRYSPRGAFLVLATMIILGCDDSTGPDAMSAGAIRVNVSTTSASVDLDPDGYSFTIDGGPSQSIATTASVTIPDLSRGRHVVQLDGLQSNCSVGGDNPRSVDLGSEGTADAPALVLFAVSCVANTGSIRVSAVTSGLSPDPDGYVVFVDNGGAPTRIAVNGSQVITGVRVGERTVYLGGLSRNCSTADPNTRKVNVTSGGTAEAAFAVQCVEAGTVQVTAITTGGGAYPDAYLVGVGNSNVIEYAMVASNGTAIIAALPLGNYVVTPHDIPAHCDGPIPGSLVVSVGVGSPTPVALNFACPPPTQIAFVQDFSGNNEISVVNSDGTGLSRLTFGTGADEDPAWSPDGMRIAYASTLLGNFDVYVMTADGTNPVRLTDSNAADRAPTWSPDGARIAFVSERDGNAEIYVMNADGTNQERLTSNNADDSAPTWSPDGRKIAFRSYRSGEAAIWVMNPDGSGGSKLTSNSLGDFDPAWSPDGSKIAFAGGVSAGSSALFIINADGSGRTRLRGLAVGGDPTWSPDGRKIAFVNSDSCLAYYDYFNWYYYDCYWIEVIGIDGTTYVGPNVSNLGQISDPSWRPR